MTRNRLLLTPNRISDWQSAAENIHMAGNPQASWGAMGSVFYENYTYIMTDRAFLQDGLVRGVTLKQRFGGTNVCKFKVFRWNGAAYSLVDERTVAMGPDVTEVVKTHIFSTPMTVRVGDVPGFYPHNASGFHNVSYETTAPATAPTVAYATGDMTTSDAFSGHSHTARVAMDFLGPRPYLACCGDSVMAGNNGATRWYTNYYDVDIPTIPGGEPTSEIPNQISARINSGNLLSYQNHSLGSTTFAWGLSTGVPAALAVKPHTLLLAFGVNDIATARSSEDMVADLDAIKVLFDASSTRRLMVAEILPWTAGSDAQAASIRSWNTTLAAWCDTNGVKLVTCHDAMGQTRVATGELDDLVTAYAKADGVHLSTAGVDALAALIRSQW